MIMAAAVAELSADEVRRQTREAFRAAAEHKRLAAHHRRRLRQESRRLDELKAFCQRNGIELVFEGENGSHSSKGEHSGKGNTDGRG